MVRPQYQPYHFLLYCSKSSPLFVPFTLSFPPPVICIRLVIIAVYWKQRGRLRALPLGFEKQGDFNLRDSFGRPNAELWGWLWLGDVVNRITAACFKFHLSCCRNYHSPKLTKSNYGSTFTAEWLMAKRLQLSKNDHHTAILQITN